MRMCSVQLYREPYSEKDEEIISDMIYSMILSKNIHYSAVQCADSTTEPSSEKHKTEHFSSHCPSQLQKLTHASETLTCAFGRPQPAALLISLSSQQCVLPSVGSKS